MPACGLGGAEIIPAARLRRAISRLLDHYPHLTGRLHFNADSNTPEITALGTGVELLEACCDGRLDKMAGQTSSGRILVTNLPGGGNALLAPFDPTTEGVCRDPILSIQHTRFACGGVALGVRLHHIVCDAQGFFTFMNHLAEVYRGLESEPCPTLAQPPEIRSIFRGPNALSPEQRQEILNYQANVYMTDDDPRLVASSAGMEDMPPEPSHSVIGRVLRFSADHLASLKAQSTDPSGKGWVSSTEAVSAFLYQRIYRARLQALQAQEDAAARLSPGFWISIDMRSPDRLGMKPQYFPNCIYPSYANSLVPSLADCPLWEVAGAVHHLIRSVDPERMRKTTMWVAAQPDKARVRVNFVFGKGSFTVSQWCKMNMYRGNDFDVGAGGEPVRPALVSPPFTPISLVDGLAMILATEEQLETGSDSSAKTSVSGVDVNLSAIAPIWEILDMDEEFVKYYT
ncbi:hypothetical protein ACO1O0_009200 [Amphichorda felina]